MSGGEQGADAMEVDEDINEQKHVDGKPDGTANQPQVDSEVSVAEQAPEEPELVPPEVNPEVLSQLKDMGFGHERSVRAVHFSGNSTLEGAINWIEEHGEDADIDTILLVPKKDSTPKRKLSPEEAKQRAADLQARAKAKREAAEKVNEKERERMRIAMGKEMTMAARAEEEQKLKRMADARKQEKEEMERARAKIHAKMEEDRKERRRKLGLPEELTEEEKEIERVRQAEKVAAEAKRRLPIKPVAKIAEMREILVTMKKTCGAADEAKFKTCCKTLTAYCRNVYTNMTDESKRRIKLENKALQERIAPVPGGLDFLAVVGFQEEDGVLVMHMGDRLYEKAVLEGAADVLDSAMNNPMFGAL